jgi:hypothetical protein
MSDTKKLWRRLAQAILLVGGVLLTANWISPQSFKNSSIWEQISAGNVAKGANQPFGASRTPDGHPGLVGAIFRSLGIGVQGENLLAAYEARNSSRDDHAVRELEAIYAAGLPPTKAVIETARRLLRSASSDEERALLAKILGSLYHQTDDVVLRNDMALDLASLVRGADSKDLGRAAALTYSRLGYFEDSVELLTLARTSGFIEDNDYYGDLAHLVPLAPSSEQSKILEKIRVANNEFSRDILATNLNRAEFVETLSSDVVSQAKSVLEMNEPAFTGSPSEYGTFDAIRYEKWLNAMRNLNDRGEASSSNDFLARKLLEPGADPRKLLAAFGSEEQTFPIVKHFDPDAIALLDRSIADFAQRNPESVMVQEAAFNARRNLGKKR